MADKKYCYPNTDILVNELNIIIKEGLIDGSLYNLTIVYQSFYMN